MFRRQRLRTPPIQARRQLTETKTEDSKNFSWKFLWAFSKIFVIVAVLLVIIWSIFSLRGKSDFAVEKVKVVTTYEHLNPAVLQNIIESYAGANFFEVNALNLREKLLLLPWVSRVSIKRRWPNTIEVDIEEQKAVAQWKDEALLSSDGMLFTPTKDTFPAGLPFLSGPEDEVQEIVVNYQKIGTILAALGLKITSLEVDEQHVWHVALNSKARIILNSENMLENLGNFVRVYSKIILGHQNEVMEEVDLRYKNGMAVKWAPARPLD